jgi:hypothetical protein
LNRYDSDSDDSDFSDFSDDDLLLSTDDELEFSFLDIDEEEAIDLSEDEKLSNNIRKRYDIAKKKAALKLFDEFCAQNPSASRQAACNHAGIPYEYYVKRWRAIVEKADAISLSANPSMHITGKTKSLNPGKASSLSPHSGTIQRAVFELREQGLPVSTRTIIREASKLDPIFKTKSDTAKASCARRLVKKMGLSHRVSTHVAQKDFKETELLAKSFLELMRVRVKDMPHDAVANMDQTPIPFAFNANKTLDWKGNRTVHLLAPGDKDRATLNATITMGGRTLKPMVIFKGKENRRIVTKELPTYSSECIWAAQKNAWWVPQAVERRTCGHPWANRADSHPRCLSCSQDGECRELHSRPGDRSHPYSWRMHVPVSTT